MKNKELIVAELAALGWIRDRICNVFQKDVETFRGTAHASFWLARDSEFDRWWLKDGLFESAGENVLAGNCAIIDDSFGPEQVAATVSKFCAACDQDLQRAYSVKLLRVLNK